MGTFQMPEFNFRLRRALDPFGSQDPGRKFGGINFFQSQQEEESLGDLPDMSMGRIPQFGQFYEEEGPAMGAYKAHLGKVPMPQDYAPSKWRRAGAVLAGVSDALGGRDGYSKARSIIRDPYETAYGEWEQGGAGLREAATMEENTANRRATTYQKILSDMFDREYRMKDLEIKWKNATTAAERKDIAREYNKLRIDADNRRTDVLEGNSKRSYGATMAGIKSREQLAEEQMFHDSIQRGLDRRSREGIAGQYRGDTGISATEQRQIEKNAVFTLSQQFGMEAVDEYFDPESGLQLKPLPPDMKLVYDRAVQQGRGTTNPYFGRR